MLQGFFSLDIMLKLLSLRVMNYSYNYFDKFFIPTILWSELRVKQTNKNHKGGNPKVR